MLTFLAISGGLVLWIYAVSLFKTRRALTLFEEIRFRPLDPGLSDIPAQVRCFWCEVGPQLGAAGFAHAAAFVNPLSPLVEMYAAVYRNR